MSHGVYPRELRAAALMHPGSISGNPWVGGMCWWRHKSKRERVSLGLGATLGLSGGLLCFFPL